MSLKACLESHALGELVRAKGIMVDVPHSAPGIPIVCSYAYTHPLRSSSPAAPSPPSPLPRAAVRDALQLMRMHGISALPVWAPPNEWVGAGGSSIMVADGSTGGGGAGSGASEVVDAGEGAGERRGGEGAGAGAGAGRARRQYIGMVSVLDVLMHFAQSCSCDDPSWALDVPISTLIGHCLEGLSCWTLPFHLSVLDSLEPMSKGVHRVLLPLPSADRPPSGPIVPLSAATHSGFSRGLLTTGCAPAYTILNQVDLIKFMIGEAQAETGGQHHHFKSSSSSGSTASPVPSSSSSSSGAAPAATGSGKSLAELLQLSVKEAGAVHGTVFAVPASMKVLDAIRCMQQAAVAAVAVLEPTPDDKLDDPMLTFGQGRCLVGTLSASDLRACGEEAALTALCVPSLPSHPPPTPFSSCHQGQGRCLVGTLSASDLHACSEEATLTAPCAPALPSHPLTHPPQSCHQGQGRCLVGTLSASDLRACSEEAALTALPCLTVGDFLVTLSVAQDVGISAAFSPYAPPPALATLASNSPASSPARVCEARSMVPITCREHSRLGAVMSQAIAGRVHRVWVVADDSSGILVGVVTLSDILRCIREHAEGER
ncbi:unnamed protein product [Closterium sp. Naga37s-1]|nr:unnamed protein product [Closterium sp. Naga37s-1]